MNTKSKDKIRDIIVEDLRSIHKCRIEISKRISENLKESLDYLRALSAQLSQPTSGLIITKTPKLARKRVVQRIETIPEDEVFKHECTSIESHHSIENVEETSKISNKSKRTASKKAADNIKKYSVTLGAKQRKPSSDDSDSASVKKEKRKGQIKRKKSITSSSDDEDSKSNAKYSKLDMDLPETKSFTRQAMKKKSPQIIEKVTAKSSIEDTSKSPKLLRSRSRSNSRLHSRSRDKLTSKNSQAEEVVKEENDTIVASNIDDVEELSMYEDAIGKPTPLMNSTLKYSSLVSEKMLNAVVMLEELPQQRKLNETVIIQKASSVRNSRESKERRKKALQDSTQPYKEIVQNDDCNGLITDDESPPLKKSKHQLENKLKITKKTKRAISSSSDDEIPNTPMRERFKDALAVVHENKTAYKSNALFSPYAKESVKKRVEAFEQAVMHSPKLIDVDAPVRITRTKTRAMTAAETERETKNTDKNVTQILARKSLAKAKKISLARQKKDNEEFKENKEQIPERINKLLLNDKSNAITKQLQQQKTPLNKIKMMQPLSVNRLHTPLNTHNLLNNAKALTASRTNIVTSVDSFIQPPRSINKTNSVEKLEEKRQEEDARKKKDEALRLQTEEKRRKRQEKELKNKLAREAKEKQELEKRQKAEREREEKAKLAFLMQEKQREEMEKKRLAQLQRAQEKEERRKLEEQQRLRKLQEQEEAERLLAEQRRREQEADKRKEAEARAQQQAAAEALRQKNQMLAAQAKYKQQINNKHQGATTNYVLDSEPDDDESDDESKPKHEIPYWAQPHVRKMQLALQRHIPQEIIYKFFDSRKCTPDLSEMFHGIDRNRLKRTSSAIWKTPPRISMMETEYNLR